MRRTFACLTVFVFASAVSVSQTRRALLIGIDTYEPPGTAVVRPDGAPKEGRFAPGLSFPNLNGPSNDVHAMREMLTSAKYGFPAANVTVLLNGQATQAGMLAAMQRYLVEEASPGDTALFYFSGYGSLRRNTLKQPSPFENTLVAADAYKGGFDVAVSDVMRVLNRAVAKGVHVTMILDAASTSVTARGSDLSSIRSRCLDYDPRDLRAELDANLSPVDSVNPVLILQSSLPHEGSFEIQIGDSSAQGLFTATLVRALEALPANAPATDVIRRVQAEMQVTGAVIQTPSLEGTDGRMRLPVFWGATASAPRAAVISVMGNAVELDVGRDADIGPGSEFSNIDTGRTHRVVVRTTAEIGERSSRAVIVSPTDAKIAPGDLMELTKWVPSSGPTLKVYVGVSNPPLASVKGALHILREAEVTLVVDPSWDRWEYVIGWNGSAWTAKAHDKPLPGNGVDNGLQPREARAERVVLGPDLEVRRLLAVIPPGSKVWFNAPLPAEFVGQLLPEGSGAVTITQNLDDAVYVMAGTATETGLGYTWYKRGDFDTEAQTPRDISRGCSAYSAYPLRTEWAHLDDGPVGQSEVAESLAEAALRLSKIDGWQRLQTFGSTSSNFPYQLKIIREPDHEVIEDGGKLAAGERYTVALFALDHTSVTPRYVYVLGIDCQGHSVVMFPPTSYPLRLPVADADGKYPGSVMLVDGEEYPPFGTDTFIMLTTATPLPNLSALNFDGLRGGERGSANPLENLLNASSSATRGLQPVIPTDWSVQFFQIHSHSNLNKSRSVVGHP